MSSSAGAVPGYLISIQDVEVEEGVGGIIGSGALGEVRRGRYKGTLCALKGLHLLRTDAASVAAFGGALTREERSAFLQKFMQECSLLQEFEHKNIVPFFGVVCEDTRAREPLYLAMQFIAGAPRPPPPAPPGWLTTPSADYLPSADYPLSHLTRGQRHATT